MYTTRYLAQAREYNALMTVAKYWGIDEQEVWNRCKGNVKKLLAAFESAKRDGAPGYSTVELIAEELDLDVDSVWDHYYGRPEKLATAYAALIARGARPRALVPCVVAEHERECEVDVRDEETGQTWTDFKTVRFTVVA